MADRIYTGETDGVLQTATNWKADTRPSGGDTLIFDADIAPEDGYYTGTAPTSGLTEDGAFAITLQGGASLSATVILADLDNQTVGNVTVATASVLAWDIAKAIGGNVSINASEINISRNGVTIAGTVAVVAGLFSDASNGTITGAVTVDATSTYAAYGNHTVTGGITVTGGAIVVYGITLTSGVILVGGNIDLEATGAITGAISDTAAGNAIDMGTAGTITGTIDLDAGACTWSGTGTAVINATSNLRLGGAATGLAVNINGAGQTVTADENISCKSLTLTAGAYVAAQTHTVADGQKLTVAGSATLTLTDAGLYVHVTSGTCTLGGALTCAGVYLDAGTTLNGAGNDVVITDSASTTVNARHRITGFGTVTNIDPVGDAIHLGPGITQGAGNTNVVADTYQDGGLDL